MFLGGVAWRAAGSGGTTAGDVEAWCGFKQDEGEVRPMPPDKED